MWGIKRKWPFSPRCKKAGEEGVHPLGRRRGEAPSRRVRDAWSRVEAVSLSTPTFGHRGALDCAMWSGMHSISVVHWTAHGRQTLASLHTHIRSSWCIGGNPALSCGLASSLRVRSRVRPLDGGDFLGRAVGGNTSCYSPRPPAPRCAPAAVFQVNGSKVIKVIASVLYI